jgi:hypothetical protein
VTKTNALEIAAVPLAIITILLMKFKVLPMLFKAKSGSASGAPGDPGPMISEPPTSMKAMWNPNTDWPGETSSQDGQFVPMFGNFAPNMPRTIDLGDPNVIGTSGPISGVNDSTENNEWAMGMP